ncbi:MAG: mercuric reductase [Acidobacteriota bacterium]
MTSPDLSLATPDEVLAAHVRPPEWVNPPPARTYDLVVIGGGTAGLVSAMGAAGLGARVALVERHLLGGDCLNTGCVPSKALIRSARAAANASPGTQLGVSVAGLEVHFDLVMDRLRRRRATIAAHDAASRVRAAGVDVFFGEARFADARSVTVGDARLSFNRAVIASGARPAAPAIPGADRVPYLTSDTVFSLTARPRHVLVLGAGPIGCELAQAFVRLGSRVTLMGRATQLLPREAADAGAVLHRAFGRDGIDCRLQTTIQRIDGEPGDVRVTFSGQDGVGLASGDALLVATGRTPNIESLNLPAADIDATAQGIVVNDFLQTTNRRVYASGDVCSRFKFTHAADALSRIVLQNALFFGRRRASQLVIPWVTFTDPEVAHVGVSERAVRDSGGRLASVDIPLHDVDRSVVDDESDGFVRVHHERGRVRGCTIVAPHAGEIIGEVAYAITHGGTMADLSATVHPYPTVAEALRKAGDAYRRQSVTPTAKQWLGRYFRLTR